MRRHRSTNKGKLEERNAGKDRSTSGGGSLKSEVDEKRTSGVTWLRGGRKNQLKPQKIR